MFYYPLRMSKPVAGVRSWFEIKNAAEPIAEIRVYDSIGYWGITADDFAAELEKVTADRIILRVNSAGGDVFDGFAIYNLLRDHPATVETKIDGFAASIASIVALAGETVTIPDSAFMMIHNPFAFVIGNSAEMRSMADVLDKIAGPMVKIYAQKTGKPADEIRDLMESETWFTGEEAVEAGLADELIKTSDDTEEDPDASADGQAAAAASIDPSIFANPPAELAGDSQPAADALEIRRRRLRLMDM